MTIRTYASTNDQWAGPARPNLVSSSKTKPCQFSSFRLRRSVRALTTTASWHQRCMTSQTDLCGTQLPPGQRHRRRHWLARDQQLVPRPCELVLCVARVPAETVAAVARRWKPLPVQARSEDCPDCPLTLCPPSSTSRDGINSRKYYRLPILYLSYQRSWLRNGAIYRRIAAKFCRPTRVAEGSVVSLTKSHLLQNFAHHKESLYVLSDNRKSLEKMQNLQKHSDRCQNPTTPFLRLSTKFRQNLFITSCVIQLTNRQYLLHSQIAID